MRVFLMACAAVLILALGALYTLNTVQTRASTRAFTTEGARITPSWSLRQVFSRQKTAPKTVAMAMPESAGMSEDCDVSSAWAWIHADFVSTPTAGPSCEH